MRKKTHPHGLTWNGWLRATLARSWHWLTGNRRAKKHPRLPRELANAEDWLLDDVGIGTGGACSPPRSRPDRRPKTFEERRAGHSWQNLK